MDFLMILIAIVMALILCGTKSYGWGIFFFVMVIISLSISAFDSFMYDDSIEYARSRGDICFTILTVCQDGQKWVVVVKDKDHPGKVFAFLSDREPPKSGWVTPVRIGSSFFFVPITQAAKVEPDKVTP